MLDGAALVGIELMEMGGVHVIAATRGGLYPTAVRAG
jgi:hypothetical protein